MRIRYLIVSLVLLLASVGAALTAPSVVFSPNTLKVAPSTAFDTPPIIIQDASGVAMVTLDITIPDGLSIDTTYSGTNLTCITKGADAGAMFFSEWNATTRKVSITCNVTAGSTLEIVKSIHFTTAANVSPAEVLLSGSVTNGSVSATFGKLSLTINRSLQVTTTPNSGANVRFSPTPVDAAQTSPLPTPFTLNYSSSVSTVSLIAPPQDSSTHPLWFDHWTLNGNNQAAGLSILSVNMTLQTNTAQAVYAGLVGDMNGDGSVNKIDADFVLQALMGDINTTSKMDVNQSGHVELTDVRWILEHTYAR
jgi:hypothetical protein